MLQIEQNSVVYPPNKALQRKIDYSLTPVVYDHLLFLDFNSKGEAILGSSSLNSTLWEGTTFFFRNLISLQSIDFERSYIGSTVSDGKFLNDETVVLAEDTGVLNILTISKDGRYFQVRNYFREDDRIARIALWKDGKSVVTCSGNAVAVWDVCKTGDKQATTRYSDYHTGAVTCVETIGDDESVFVSTARDRRCCLWDSRLAKPATVLYRNEFCALTTVASNRNDENFVVVGSESGDVYILDRRRPGDFVSVVSCGDYDLCRIVFDSKTDQIAVCGDSNKIWVYKCVNGGFKESYIDHGKHCEVVRGLAWCDKDLYSCGFDRNIIKHVL